MKKSILIIGGSPAGLQAALDLADSGIEVHIAETSPYLLGLDHDDEVDAAEGHDTHDMGE